MKLVVILALVLSTSGCAFYQKDYVSKIYLDGKNYPGGDEGQFYIDNEPLIRMSFGCYKTTQLTATVFPLIPLPGFNEAEPHTTIAENYFYMVLEYDESSEVAPSTLTANITIADKTHALMLLETEQVSTIIPRYRYNYGADLSCGDIQAGTLNIGLHDNKEREYKIEFREDVERQVRYHLMFVT
jgi:hypothetical protein